MYMINVKSEHCEGLLTAIYWCVYIVSNISISYAIQYYIDY